MKPHTHESARFPTMAREAPGKQVGKCLDRQAVMQFTPMGGPSAPNGGLSTSLNIMG